MTSECSEGNAASFSAEEAAKLVAKLFGIVPDIQNKNMPREKFLPSVSCAKVLRKSSFYFEKNKMEKAKKLLSENIGGKCDTPYDLFNANRFLGAVLSAEGKLALSIEAHLAAQLYRFEGDNSYIDSFYTVSQLYYVQGEYEKSIAQAKEYFVLRREVAPEQVILMATSYYKLDQYNEALKYALQGLQLAELINQDIPKVWYELLWNIYYDNSDYNSALSTTKVMVRAYPEGKYQKRYAMLCKKVSDHKYCS
jgi:tetratricopeptide (TPR) repeat protein